MYTKCKSTCKCDQKYKVFIFCDFSRVQDYGTSDRKVGLKHCLFYCSMMIKAKFRLSAGYSGEEKCLKVLCQC